MPAADPGVLISGFARLQFQGHDFLRGFRVQHVEVPAERRMRIERVFAPAFRRFDLAEIHDAARSPDDFGEDFFALA